MTCLRAARAQGVIPATEEGLWGGLVPLTLLQQALIHKHDQVSLFCRMLYNREDENDLPPLGHQSEPLPVPADQPSPKVFMVI